MHHQFIAQRLHKWTHLCKQYQNNEIEHCQHHQKSPLVLSQTLHPNGNYFPFFLNHTLVLHVFTFYVIEVIHNVLLLGNFFGSTLCL